MFIRFYKKVKLRWDILQRFKIIKINIKMVNTYGGEILKNDFFETWSTFNYIKNMQNLFVDFP